MKSVGGWPSKVLKAILCFLMVGLRPLLGPDACRFEQGCTKYAVEMVKTKPFLQALWLIIKRLAACNPF